MPRKRRKEIQYACGCKEVVDNATEVGSLDRYRLVAFTPNPECVEV